MTDSPSTLSGDGLAKWQEIVPRLRSTNPKVMTAVEIYCVSYQRWIDAQRWLDEHGDVLEIISDKGIVIKAQPAPKLDVSARAEKSMAEAMRVIGSYLT